MPASVPFRGERHGILHFFFNDVHVNTSLKIRNFSPRDTKPTPARGCRVAKKMTGCYHKPVPTREREERHERSDVPGETGQWRDPLRVVSFSLPDRSRRPWALRGAGKPGR